MPGLNIGYARVSTDQQDLTAQRDGLQALSVPPERIYVDHGLTGANRERPGCKIRCRRDVAVLSPTPKRDEADPLYFCAPPGSLSQCPARKRNPTERSTMPLFNLDKADLGVEQLESIVAPAIYWYCDVCGASGVIR